MSTKYTITGGPYTLKQLVSKVKLPQVVLVTQGFYGATDRDTVSSGQVMVVFFVKRVKGVTGIHNKRSFHIPLNSAMQFAPVPSEGIQDTYETVADIFEKEPTPAVVATVNLTQDAHGQVVRPGTILFPSRSKKTLRTKLKSLRKKGEMPNAEFTTTVGTKVYLPMDCAASFSTQVKNVKLYLPELMAHLTLPVEVKCFAQQKSRHCSKMSNITLTEVCKEVSITGGLTVEGSKVKDHQFDVPLDLPVQVACIDLAKEELQQSLYARVKSTYESVDRRFATNKKVVVSGDACDMAQQEFYCTVRTDIAQDVVTVDVPERIYDEVGFGNAKWKRTSSTYKVKQCPNSARAHPAPKQPAPPLPSHCFERSKDEPYEQLMNRAGAIQDNGSALIRVPTPSAPLPHSNFGITTVPAAIDTYDEPTTPQSSTNAQHTHKGSTASSVRPQVPIPPLPPPLQKTTTANHHEPSVPLNSTALPTLRDATSKMRNPTAALSVPPPLPAQEKKQIKCTPPPLHIKPLQPVLTSPPQALPRRQEAIYEEIQPDALNANVYTSLVRDIPIPPRTRLKPAPKPVTHTKPQLKVSESQAGGSNPHPVDEVGNIKYLRTLSCNDIIRLLEAMGLHQYIDSFMKEHIDGELLVSMTDEELQEVGVTSSLHRKRFTKVITGRHSAEQLLECGNPYASMSSHP